MSSDRPKRKGIKGDNKGIADITYMSFPQRYLVFKANCDAERKQRGSKFDEPTVRLRELRDKAIEHGYVSPSEIPEPPKKKAKKRKQPKKKKGNKKTLGNDVLRPALRCFAHR